jgi:hypothetical protein
MPERTTALVSLVFRPIRSALVAHKKAAGITPAASLFQFNTRLRATALLLERLDFRSHLLQLELHPLERLLGRQLGRVI